MSRYGRSRSSVRRYGSAVSRWRRIATICLEFDIRPRGRGSEELVGMLRRNRRVPQERVREAREVLFEGVGE